MNLYKHGKITKVSLNSTTTKKTVWIDAYIQQKWNILSHGGKAAYLLISKKPNMLQIKLNSGFYEIIWLHYHWRDRIIYSPHLIKIAIFHGCK